MNDGSWKALEMELRLAKMAQDAGDRKALARSVQIMRTIVGWEIDENGGKRLKLGARKS